MRCPSRSTRSSSPAARPPSLACPTCELCVVWCWPLWCVAVPAVQPKRGSGWVRPISRRPVRGPV
eukprot:5839212-Prymnesium_polylepis.1